MKNYYKPSGKFSPISLMYFLLLSVTAFPLLGLIYAYCIWYIPFVFINILFTAIFGFLIGYLINSAVIEKGKVRNVTVAFVFGLVGGFLALYFHWAVWTDLVINAGESYGNSRIGVSVSNIKIVQVFSLIIQPETLFDLINEINFYGTWGVRSNTVNGTFLLTIWIIEFLIIVGIAILSSLMKVKEPFCEKENIWFKKLKLGPFEYLEDPSKIVKELENGDSQQIMNIQLNEDPIANHSIFTLFMSNYRDSYLSIENKESKINKKGKLEFDSDIFLEYIFINEPLKELLLKKESENEII
tara:strand:+ start:10679 stop:11575 length:897 start_codon:yes stop_codon:yes gene_type:complete